HGSDLNLNLDETTGLISSGSDPGVYNVTYTSPDRAIRDPRAKTVNVSISKLPDPTLSLQDDCGFCITAGEAVINSGFEPGGVFTSNNTSFNLDQAGIITWDPEAITPGQYEITYTISEELGCEEVSLTQTITIYGLPKGGVTSFLNGDRTFVMCENPTSDYKI